MDTGAGLPYAYYAIVGEHNNYKLKFFKPTQRSEGNTPTTYCGFTFDIVVTPSTDSGYFTRIGDELTINAGNIATNPTTHVNFATSLVVQYKNDYVALQTLTTVQISFVECNIFAISTNGLITVTDLDLKLAAPPDGEVAWSDFTFSHPTCLVNAYTVLCTAPNGSFR